MRSVLSEVKPCPHKEHGTVIINKLNQILTNYNAKHDRRKISSFNNRTDCTRVKRF